MSKLEQGHSIQRAEPESKDRDRGVEAIREGILISHPMKQAWHTFTFQGVNQGTKQLNLMLRSQNLKVVAQRSWSQDKIQLCTQSHTVWVCLECAKTLESG